MLTMYSTSWCGYCHRLMSQLDREGIGYEVIDIEHDTAAARYVMSVNSGDQTVPTRAIPGRLEAHEPIDHPGQGAPDVDGPAS